MQKRPMCDRISRAEARSAGALHYFTGAPCKRGHVDRRYTLTATCVACGNIASKARRHLDIATRPPKSPKPNISEAERKAKADRAKLLRDRWLHDNKERRLKKDKEWKQRNVDKVRITVRATTKRNRQRKPPWVDSALIKRIYANCPEGYEVDHIVPLNGAMVSGLHVPWNLQYLPISENRRKRNRWPYPDSEVAIHPFNITL